MFEKLFAQDGLSLERLRALVEVADAGGMAAAAPNDPGKQSQYSHQINRLRAFFGVELTQRKGKGIELTEAGQKLAQQAKAYLTQLEDFLDEAQGQPIELRLGANQTAVDWLLVPILPELSRLLSGARFVVRGCRSKEVTDGLLDGDLDFGLVRSSAVISPRLMTSRFSKVGYSLFVRTDIAQRFQNDALRLLAAIPLTTAMGGEFRRQLDAGLEGAGIEPDLRFVFSSFREALELVRREPSLGALLPSTAEKNLPASEFTQLDLVFLDAYRRQLVLAWNPKTVSLRRGAKEALELLKATGEQLSQK